MEPSTFFVKPARPGLIVPKPENIRQALAEDGEWVSRSTYWLRRLRDGDIVVAQPEE